ncbi:MAG: hypothetical protein SV765_18875 [Pseudomonadota bacterium]|nr:hypothetical protein [Pseudomonadota bacterium]
MRQPSVVSRLVIPLLLIAAGWAGISAAGADTSDAPAAQAPPALPEFHSWQQLADWARLRYPEPPAENAALDTVVNALRQQADSDDGRISAALRLVQDRIETLDQPLWQTAIQPAPVTLQQQSGSSEDKAQLLVVLLNRLGVEAYPALVNTQPDPGVALSPSQPGLFDHVLVQVITPDRHWWLDPRRQYQWGALDLISPPDNGRALVLRPGSDSLTPINATPEPHGLQVSDRFVLAADTSETVLFTTSSLYQGRQAERQRQQLASQGEAALQQRYLDFYRYFYPTIEVRLPLVIKDNQARNTLAITEYYRIAGFWELQTDEQRWIANFYPHTLNSYLSPEPVQSDAAPLHLHHPEQVRHSIEIEFESRDWQFEDETVLRENPFFLFQFQARYYPVVRQLKLDYEYRPRVRQVAADDLPAYNAAAQAAAELLGYGIFQSADPSPWSLEQSAEEQAMTWGLWGVLAILVSGLGFLLWHLLKPGRGRPPGSAANPDRGATTAPPPQNSR